MNRKLLNLIQTQKGLALVSVLAMVTLATVIILALFSVSDSEFKASKVYAGGNAARQLADSAVNIVIGQIRSATYSSPNVTRNWASQPGAIRVYEMNGSFYRGHKLYSDAEMIVTTTGTTGEERMSRDAPPGTWNVNPDQYVDLNEPVVRVTSGTTNVYFPVVDPRAAQSEGSFGKVEGFSYSAKPPTGGGDISGVRETAAGGQSIDLRLPMPVEWLYVLQDGTMGTVTSTGIWSGGAAPNADNQIVGRVAFWADDESCKLNINTASEPGYWAVPTFYHDRDKGWADCPPTLHEYQRFPGHPATVALSTVLYPSSTNAPRFLDTYPLASTGTSPDQALAIKERIYQIIPKLNGGGSMDGRLAFVGDDIIPQKASAISLLTSKTERLYATLDELLFSETMIGNERQENDFTVNGMTLLTPGTLEKTRFFLTAQSRAPELNIFSRPRVAMWPVPDSTLGESFRTGYDGAIATVATLGNPATSSNTYYFSRRNADNQLEDIGHDPGGASGLARNLSLMAYLDHLMGKTFPGGSSFKTKYGSGRDGYDDSRQILVEIFDYIRCTNLYDSYLAPKFVLTEGALPNDRTETELGGMDYRWHSNPGNTRSDGKGNSEIETGKSSNEFKYNDFDGEQYTHLRADTLNGIVNGRKQGKPMYRSYTEPRFKFTKFHWGRTPLTQDLTNEIVSSGVYPGHGQVTPAEWQVGDKKYKGFGRFPTISEVGLHFICTADGKNDDGSKKVKTTNKTSGGRTAEKIDNDDSNRNKRVAQIKRVSGEDTKEYWYSNFPPYPERDTITDVYGCVYKDKYLRGDDTNPRDHPGCDPSNWNCTLKANTPLEEHEKRIQVALQIEFFVPSVGFTKICPEFTMVLSNEGLQGVKVRDVVTGKLEPVFSTNEPLVLKSNTRISGGVAGGVVNDYGSYHGSTGIGGPISIQALTHNRRVKGVGEMPADPSYDTNPSSNEHAHLYNYALVGSFVTVHRDALMEFVVDEPLKIDIYADHNWQNSQPVQTINLEFPERGEAPPPELVVYSTEKRLEETWLKDAVDACRWWTFHWGGALNRYRNVGTVFNSSSPASRRDWKVEVVNKASGDWEIRRTRGRFDSREGNSFTAKYDSKHSGINGKTIPTNGTIYGYMDSGQFTGVRSRPSDRMNKDVYKPSSLREMGEYGFFGADTIRSIIPKYADYRLVAAQREVPGKIWQKHPLYDNNESFFAHNFASSTDIEVGYYKGGMTDAAAGVNTNRLVPKQDYQSTKIPDTPHTAASSQASGRYGDFDNGPSSARDGAYINKPDEGNLSAIRTWWPDANGAEHYLRNAYLIDTQMQMPTREAYFTPNRMISSPGMLGSLPTGVFGSQPKSTNPSSHSYVGDSKIGHGEPWRTLLFRPNVGTANSTSKAHPGAPSSAFGVDPADHYIMDLFWMPVVEPYAVTDNWSTAGKINMNFQIVPFTYINRATGMYAAMKGELVTAIPKEDGLIKKVAKRAGGDAERSYKDFRDNTGKTGSWEPWYWSETQGKFWHRYIDLAITTNLMKARMDWDGQVNSGARGLFRTASQICEIHLVPQSVLGAAGNPADGMTPGNAMSQMRTFWLNHALTGDNTRERPYASLYQKLTTRSNTFRVYFRAQALKKARSLAPTQVNTAAGAGGADTIVAEYRGSALLERYLDLSNASVIPNYADGSDPLNRPSLEGFYRYRVLETKQFAP